MADNIGNKPRGPGRRFGAGQPGNKAGRPPGARNKATMAIEALLEGEAEALGRKAVDMALKGDGIALRLCLERIAPVRRGRPVKFSLPVLERPSDLVKALGSILEATAAGDLTPEEASTVAAVLETKRRAHETVELEGRLAALERAANPQ